MKRSPKSTSTGSRWRRHRRTAPKDGTVVTVQCEGGEDYAAFDGEWTSHFGYGEPTAWRQFLGNLAEVRQVYS